MKILGTVALLALARVATLACTILPAPFCVTLDSFPTHALVLGTIEAIDGDGLDLAVLDVVRGTETRSAIRVWDGTDFDCNGPFSLAASTIGAVGDTVLINLPRIAAPENPWDVVGDYRRPDPYHFVTELTVRGDSLRGYVGADPAAAPREAYQTTAFLDALRAGGDCAAISSTDEATDLGLATGFSLANPIGDRLEVRFPSARPRVAVALYDARGRRVAYREEAGAFAVAVAVAHLPAGVYVLELRTPGRAPAVRRVVKA